MTDALNWYGEDVATFGDRLEAARRNANLSQRELAKAYRYQKFYPTKLGRRCY